MKKIRAIFFDLGGVVLTQKAEVRLETIAEAFELDKNDLEVVFKKYSKDWSTGKISATILAKQLKQEFKFKKGTQDILRNWKKVYERKTLPNKELLNLIDELRKTYKIYLLTNTVDLHHNINSKRSIFNHFDQVFASFIIGKRKPDSDIYEHALKKVNLKAAECIFTDDLKKNINAAKNLGFNTILFQNNESFIRELNGIGIKI